MSRSIVAAAVVAVLVPVVSAGCGAPATVAAAPSASVAAPVSPSSTPAAPPARSSTTPSVPAASPAKPKPSTTSARPVEVPETLRFEATTVDGKSFDPATLAGKPALFWFWAPWCPTCKAQTPDVQKLAKEYEGKVTVVGVGSLDGGNAIQRFADDAWGMTHLTDAKGSVWKHFGVVEQSSFLLLDAKGEKVFSTGYGGSDQLPDQVARVAS